MLEPKQLVENGICISFAEARRMLQNMTPEEINKLIEKNKKRPVRLVAKDK